MQRRIAVEQCHEHRNNWALSEYDENGKLALRLFRGDPCCSFERARVLYEWFGEDREKAAQPPSTEVPS